MSQDSATIKIMIADDHAVVRQGIEKMISKTEDMVIVAEAVNGIEILDKLKQAEVDVLLMDIEMPGKNGWDVLANLQQLQPDLPVIILSIFPEEHYGPRFIKAGARGYLNKASPPANILKAIRKVHQGGKYVSPELAERLIQEMGTPSEAQPHQTLSGREFQVFCLIAAGKKLKEIADELSVGITTISTHRARILEKMKMKNNAELIRYAVKHGLVD